MKQKPVKTREFLRIQDLATSPNKDQINLAQRGTDMDALGLKKNATENSEKTLVPDAANPRNAAVQIPDADSARVQPSEASPEVPATRAAAVKDKAEAHAPHDPNNQTLINILNGDTALEDLKIWEPGKLKERAEFLLENFDKIKTPEFVFCGLKDPSRRARNERNFKVGLRRLLELTQQGYYKKLWKHDYDGTRGFKAMDITQLTDSLSSSENMAWLRACAVMTHMLGWEFDQLTARTALAAGQTREGAMGYPDIDPKTGKKSIQATPAVISGLLSEYGVYDRSKANDAIIKTLGMQGLSGLVSVKKGGVLETKPRLEQFGHWAKAAENWKTELAPNGVHHAVEDMIKDGMLRVFEEKTVPQSLLNNREAGFTLLEYMDAIDLCQNYLENKNQEEFLTKFQEKNFHLNDKYKSIISSLDPSDADAANKVLTLLRNPMLGCKTVHFVNNMNVIDRQAQTRYVQVWDQVVNSPESRKWIAENVNDVDKERLNSGKSMLNINGRSFDAYDLQNLCTKDGTKKFNDIIELIDYATNDNIEKPKEHVAENLQLGQSFIRLLVNGKQPYVEALGDTDKSEVWPHWREMLASGTAPIGGGDSNSDILSVMFSTLFGLGIKVKQTVSKDEFFAGMVDLLASGKIDGHDDELKRLDDGTYQNIKSGEIKTHHQWAEILSKKYEQNFIEFATVDEANAGIAGILSTIAGVDPQKLIDPKAKWREKLTENQFGGSLYTPDTGLIAKVNNEGEFKKPGFLDPKNFPNIFNNANTAFSSILGVGGAIGAAATALHKVVPGLEKVKNVVDISLRSVRVFQTWSLDFLWGRLNQVPAYNMVMTAALNTLSALSPRGSTLDLLARNSALFTVWGARSWLGNVGQGLYVDKNDKSKENQAEIEKRFPNEKTRKKEMDLMTRSSSHVKAGVALSERLLHGKDGKGTLISKIPVIGETLARSAGEIYGVARAGLEELKNPRAFVTDMIANFTDLKNQGKGIKRFNVNSCEYKSVWNLPGVQAAFSVVGGAASVASALLAGMGFGGASRVLSSAVGLGSSALVTVGGIENKWNRPGYPGKYRDLNGVDRVYNPEKAGNLEAHSGRLMALASVLQMLPGQLGAFLFDTANGLFGLGVGPKVRMSTLFGSKNILMRQGKLFKSPKADMKTKPELHDFVKQSLAGAPVAKPAATSNDEMSFSA